MKTKRIFIVCFLFWIVCSVSFAGDDFPEVKAEEVKQIMDSGNGTFLLNPLSDIEFDQQHIPGSTNVPLHTIETSDRLPKDKNTPIITYCLGPKCIMSIKAAQKLSKLGYTNIKVFKDGIPGWAMKGYALNTENALPKTKVEKVKVNQLKKLLGQVFILDIRETKNRAKLGWIKESHHIPFARLSSMLNEIPKDKTVVVMDHAGKQVLTACLYLKSKGYSDVKRFQGGMMKWVTKGLPVER